MFKDDESNAYVIFITTSFDVLGHILKKDISIVIQIRWKFHFFIEFEVK